VAEPGAETAPARTIDPHSTLFVYQKRSGGHRYFPGARIWLTALPLTVAAAVAPSRRSALIHLGRDRARRDWQQCIHG
jgi:hypothetical protein